MAQRVIISPLVLISTNLQMRIRFPIRSAADKDRITNVRRFKLTDCVCFFIAGVTMREKKGGALQKLKKRLSHSFGRLSEYKPYNSIINFCNHFVG